MKTVSIIVPVYRGEEFIENCIESLLSQTYSRIEVIVVIQEPSEKALEILNKYDEIVLIKQARRTSPAIARNVGLEYANGEYISFCDVDDWYSREKVEKQVTLLEKNPGVGLVYTDVILYDSKRHEIARFTAKEWNRKRWLTGHFIMLSSVIVRKEILNEVGYFDENLPTCEDLDLLIRLSEISEFKRLAGFLTFRTLHSKSWSKTVSFDWWRLKIYKKYNLVRPFFISSSILIADRIPILHTLKERMLKRFRSGDGN